MYDSYLSLALIRGMDYPDVTLVIMMGMTTRDQYVHRLGRTARAGKEGSGILLCSPDEFLFMSKELSGMPLTKLPTESVVSETKTKDVQNILDLRRHFPTEADSAWGAWLGYYNSETKRLGWTSEDLFREAKLYAQAVGLNEIPILPARTLSKMGLSKAAGFRSEVDTPRKSGGRNSDASRERGMGDRERGVLKARRGSTR
jgi:ATP-dependent RNA helicase MSS116, mitochondrial